jgi:hypothetical protein
MYPFYTPNKAPILAYDSLEDMFNYWKSNHKRGLEAKFIKPETLINWEWTIRRCTYMVKMLKTIYYKTPCKQYNVRFLPQSFWRSTTFDIEYQSANYALVVKTGLSVSNPYSNAIPSELYIEAEKLLNKLIEQMQREMPYDESTKIMKIFDSIKAEVH